MCGGRENYSRNSSPWCICGVEVLVYVFIGCFYSLRGIELC